MGTTLTGTTPQDTYDSLIKVTDNGPLSGTLKALSDGLGNDSTLSLSTTAASIAGTLAVTGNATFDTNTLFVDAAANEVGIGTTSPSGKLHISATSGVASLGSTALAIRDSAAPDYGFDFTLEGVASGDMSLVRTVLDVQSQVMTFKRSNGNVGIGTSAPAVPLDVVGDIRSSTGILFGADTAAANLLDDYEEGTWTLGVSFGGASVGVTYSFNTGTYTKIGRQVTASGYLVLTNKGSSTGLAALTGLPFSIPNSSNNHAPANFWLNNVTFANQFQGYGQIGATQIFFQEITILGVQTNLTNADFANNSEVMVSFTYFV